MRFWLPLLSFLAVGCAQEKTVVVAIATDIDCHDAARYDLDTLIEVDGQPPTAVATSCDPATHHMAGTATFVVDSERVKIHVVAGVHTDAASCANAPHACIEARRDVEVKETVAILMSTACQGVVCGAAETCALGRCVAASLDDPEGEARRSSRDEDKRDEQGPPVHPKAKSFEVQGESEKDVSGGGNPSRRGLPM